MKVFLTGGTGYLGQRLAAALVDAGHELACLSRSRERAAPLRALGADVVIGDITDFDAVDVDLSRFDAFIHSAALVKTRVKDPSDFDRINVSGVANAAGRCLAAGVSKFIYTSSFMALGPAGDDGVPLDESALHDPHHIHNDYERTKYLGLVEFQRWLERGLPGVVLIPCVIYGPGALTSGNLTAATIADIVLGRLAGILGDGTRIWSYAYIGDVVAGHLLALERGKPGERYILGGESASMEDFIRMVAEIAGVDAPTRHIPFWLAKIAALAEEVKSALFGREPKITRQVIEVYKHHWVYTSKKARRELGYETIPLREGLAETVAWIKHAVNEGTIT